MQGAALPKEILDTQLYLYSYMLHHLYCCLSRWASIATCRSLAANKDFGDHICLMVDGFCAHTGSRRAPSVRASARSARGKFSPQTFVRSVIRSDLQRFSGSVVRGRFQIFLSFVRKKYILFGRVVIQANLSPRWSRTCTRDRVTPRPTRPLQRRSVLR